MGPWPEAPGVDQAGQGSRRYRSVRFHCSIHISRPRRTVPNPDEQRRPSSSLSYKLAKTGRCTLNVISLECRRQFVGGHPELPGVATSYEYQEIPRD